MPGGGELSVALWSVILTRLCKQVLEAQKQESLKATKLAEVNISELEEELENCRSSLEQERAAGSLAREEFRRSCRQLQEENSLLKKQAAKVLY